jgi:hypothetical protein
MEAVVEEDRLESPYHTLAKPKKPIAQRVP